MIVEGKLWVALRANVFSDQTKVKDDFQSNFQRMMSNLATLFTIPSLNRNMRNSPNINKASQGLKETSSLFTVRSTIEKLQPPITTSSNPEPKLIPVHMSIFESNFQEILSQAVFNLKKKTVIMHSTRFKGKDLKSLFLMNFPEIEQENILQHDDYPNNATKDALQDFLKDPEIKIAIFLSKFVTGMESSNVIYFHDAKEHFNISLRCTMTRAVSHLCIILRFSNRDFPPTYKSMKVNNKFVKCKKIFKKYDYYSECFSCKTKQICISCLISCHQKHETDYQGMVDWKRNMKCNCINSNCCIKKD